MKKFVAMDLGASNGRTIRGRFDGQKLFLDELNRFENYYVRVGNDYFWDILHLFSCIKDGLQMYAKTGGTLSGIGIDTWGVDFGLVDSQGRLLGNPRAYRDPRGYRGRAAFHEKYGERTAFDITGIANIEINTLYQLYDMALSDDPQLQIADKLLMMPDLLGYMLCGVMSTEYTNASTMQMIDSRTGGWSKDIIQMVGVSETLFGDIQMSGEIKGPLYDSIQQEIGLKNIPPVICVGSHDTASAVASVPAEGENYAFISSGTWSLIGIVSENALINDTVYDNHFSNEGTVDGGYRPLRNIMGLWIIQNCRRQWLREAPIDWGDIVDMAAAAPAFRSFIDVNAHMFFDGDDMPRKIQQYCKDTGQPVPQTKGEIARTVYESLALSYRESFLGLEQLRDGRIDVMHIVGGGSQNRMLNQFTANALDREVVAGPAEATAIGNLMIQLKASNDLKDIHEMRQVIRNSFDVESYEPQQAAQWAEEYERYLKIKNQ